MTTLTSDQDCFVSKARPASLKRLDALIARDLELSALRLQLAETFKTDALELFQDPENDLFAIRVVIDVLRANWRADQQDEMFHQIRFALWTSMKSARPRGATAFIEQAQSLVDLIMDSSKGPDSLKAFSRMKA